MITTTFSARFGHAPLGSEVLSWDSYEDDYGCKHRYEFFVIPHETVTEYGTLTNEDVSLEGLIMWLATESETAVVSCNVSRSNGDFICMGWHRPAEAITIINNFMKGL
jgi:hypothetical protein